MFKSLSNDLLTRIYEYDPTYKEKFNHVLDGLLTPKMKILQKFLVAYDGPDMIHMGSKWQVMKKTEFRNGPHYYEITFFNIFKTTFYVMTQEERDSQFDNPTNKTCPNIIRSHLYRMSPNNIANVIGCNTQTISTIQENIVEKHCCNDVLYDLLGNGYDDYVDTLRMDGIFDQEIHKYLFEDMLLSRKDYYLEQDSTNYHYYVDEDDEDEVYYIYWNMSTANLMTLYT